MLPTLLALAVGCFGSSPDVVAVTPEVAMPGDSIRLTGTAYDDEIQGFLVQGATEIPLPVDVLSDTEATGTVPDTLPSGTWTVRVVSHGGRHGAERPLEVWRVDTEPACDKRYALVVETSRTHRRVSVERIFKDRARTHDHFEGNALAGLERTATPTKAGATCHAIWLLLQDGGRVLLVDDTTRDLAPVVKELAATLDLSIKD